MTMYEELVKSLRAQADYYCCHMGINSPPAMMFIEAADAIEELQKKYDKTQDALITADITRIYLEDVLKYIKTLAENCKAHNRWIPVTERLPENRADYLARIVSGEFKQVSWIEIASFDGHIFRWEHNSEECPEEVTHWMPLPQMSKEKT